jgi:hypothetical protein
MTVAVVAHDTRAVYCPITAVFCPITDIATVQSQLSGASHVVRGPMQVGVLGAWLTAPLVAVACPRAVQPLRLARM